MRRAENRPTVAMSGYGERSSQGGDAGVLVDVHGGGGDVRRHPAVARASCSLGVRHVWHPTGKLDAGLGLHLVGDPGAWPLPPRGPRSL